MTGKWVSFKYILEGLIVGFLKNFLGSQLTKILVFQQKNNFVDPLPLKKPCLVGQKGKNLNNVVVGVQDLGYCFFRAGEDV